ncbi:baseplate assembly protein [Hungatella effluvii]|uniref:baseplate assembly protein n=1 Tax=Hungatella effluvii TaxID=1096246 RepID=UPI002A83B9A5|nr:baseplate J/gp47 family protein [Hungatella effluvii]
MADLKPIEEYPDISFMDNYTIQKLENDMLIWFLEKRKEITGEDTVLASADDRRILLQTGAYFIFQGYMFSDDAGKMGLLKYSRGKFLENLGALKHISRNGAVSATVTIRFVLKEPRLTTTGIPEGTRLTAGDGVYFSTLEYGEIRIGETVVEITAVCMTPGSAGNNYEIGDISTIVDPVPYIDGAENITRPENGTDIEDDESLRKRIYMAPSAYSTAGTNDAYAYFVREFNSEVSDVRIISPAPCIVEIRYLLKEGEVPGEESICSLKEYLSQPSIRPLTDQVVVKAPELIPYDLKVKYYINQSDSNRVISIKTCVEEAIRNYEIWQRSKMGRDINPNELIRLILVAGAKRVEITSPDFKVVGAESVASLHSETISYGGLEDD